jgi:hypothetical protein
METKEGICMGRIDLIVWDNDARFMERLCAYIADHYRHRFRVRAFSDEARFLEALEAAGAGAFALAAKECLGGWAAKARACPVAALTRGDAPGVAGVAGVSRYLGAEGIVRDVLRIRSGRPGGAQDADMAAGPGEGRVALAFSFWGGAGRTSVARGLCARFAAMGKRALYLGLDWNGLEWDGLGSGAGAGSGESGPGTGGAAKEDGPRGGAAKGGVPGWTGPAYGGAAPAPAQGAGGKPGGGGISELLYAAKARPETLAVLAESLRRRDAAGGFDCYGPPDYPMDLQEPTPQETELLIGKLRGMGAFDRVVVDTHAGMSARNAALIGACDDALLVAAPEAPPGGGEAFAGMSRALERCLGEGWRAAAKRVKAVVNESPRAAAAFAAQGVPAPGADAWARDAAAWFPGGAFAVPFCPQTCGRHCSSALGDVGNAFGAAMAAMARRL